MKCVECELFIGCDKRNTIAPEDCKIFISIYKDVEGEGNESK